MEIIYRLWLRYSVPLLVTAIIVLLGATFTYTIREDEAWIGEQAYWLHNQGSIFSVLWQGYHDHEKEVVVHHYLFVRLTAWLLNVLPWNVLTLRLIPLLSGLALTVAIMAFAFKELKWTKLQVFGLGALFILIPINFEYLTYYRPEFVVTLFGFGSFWALYRCETKWRYAAIAGLLAGLAMLTHLNGLVFVGAGGIVLLLKRDLKGTFLFGLLAVLAFSPYLLEIAQKYEMFRLQLSAGANTGGGQLSWYSPLVNLINEQKRLFRGPFTIFTSALLLASALLVYKFPKQAGVKFSLTYLLLVLLFLGMFAVSKTSQYSILFYPQAALVIMAALILFQEGKKIIRKWQQWFYLICWYTFTLFAIGCAIIPFVTPQPNLEKTHAELAEGIPAGKKFLAPMAFIFNQINKHEILALTTLFELDHYDLKVDDFVDYTRKNNIEYLVLNQMWKGRINDLEENKQIFNRHFQELKTVNELTIYKVQ